MECFAASIGTLICVNIRMEYERDWPTVRDLHFAPFGDHGRVVADLVDELRDLVATGEGLSLVAEDRDAVVGHTVFTRSWLDATRRLVPVQVLSPVGVLPASQHQGIGTTMIRRGLELLTERDVPVVFVEGPPKYYPRFGFRAGAVQGFRKPSLRIPDAAFPPAPAAPADALTGPSHSPTL
jgi:putative acetyltransferase